jgi:Rrf2 family protein
MARTDFRRAGFSATDAHDVKEETAGGRLLAYRDGERRDLGTISSFIQEGAVQITRTTDYGIRVLTHLAMLPAGTRLTASELAAASHASDTFVAKILQRLVASRLVVSRRGFDGGFELGREPREISVLDIVTALEGPLCLNTCLPGGAGCEDAGSCATRDLWVRAQAALASVLGAETLERLASASVQQHQHLAALQPVGAAAPAPVALR